MKLLRRDTAASGASRRAPADLDPEVEGLVEESRRRVSRPPSGRDRWVSALIAGAFVGAALPLALLPDSGRHPSALTIALVIVVYAIVSHVQFEVGTGSVVPTQLVLVPMLFVLPAGMVPLCVAAGLVLDHAVEVARGRAPLGRILVILGSSWHAVGPALVLVLAGEAAPGLHLWPLYLAALAAQFAFDFVSAAARDWLVLGVSPRAELRFMGWVYLVDAVLAPVGLLAAMAAVGYTTLAFLLALPLVGLLGIFARERRTRIDHALELSQAYRGTAFLLGDVVEADDAYTGSHSRDVVSLVLDVSDALGLDAADRRRAEFAALLHDVGKIRIPGEIINKPGPLTHEERAIVDTHTIEGEKLLERVGGLLGEVGRIVRSCHERWDGDGYPDGLTGEEIPLVARVVSCCDAYNAMTTTRSYRAALPAETAITELRAHAGAQFDPAVVDALVRIVEGEWAAEPARRLAAVAQESLQTAY